VATRIGLEHAEWLVEQGRLEEAAALLPPLHETAERLGEVHWRARLAAISEQGGVTATNQA
jgi:hypothetical protein